MSPTERIFNWLFGFILGGMLTFAVGKSLIQEHGRRLIPILWVAGILAGLLLGWAINEFIDYASLTSGS